MFTSEPIAEARTGISAIGMTSCRRTARRRPCGSSRSSARARAKTGFRRNRPKLSATSSWRTINKPTVQEKIADGLVLFSKMVDKYKAAHVEAQVAGRFLLAKPTRLKYLMHLEQRIVPQWGNRRLCEINPDEVQQWLFETCDSWHMMNDLRGIMSGIYTKAEEWGYWPEGRRNPISRVKIGEKWSVRPERILTEEETVRVLARLSDPNLLSARNRNRHRRAHLRNPGAEVAAHRSSETASSKSCSATGAAT